MCAHRWAFCLGLASLFSSTARGGDGNRLTYLDESDPYYVSRTFPRLVTPQWVGEEGVEAVVVLAIDDMRDPEKYEKFLRPILQRLKRIDGRAARQHHDQPGRAGRSRICRPGSKRDSAWRRTRSIIPVRFFKGGDFAKARATYERCVDLMNDSPQQPARRLSHAVLRFAQHAQPALLCRDIQGKTAKGNFLTIDSSVFNLFTSNDPELPRELVVDTDGQDRFRKYLPTDRTFVNTIENYPYPYVIGRLCWEFPCVMPSDWVAQHRHQPNNPITVRDWKAALDATVLKHGVFCLVFHPHGWIRNEQIVDFIDYAATKHGKKVKFLNFREAQERLEQELAGRSTAPRRRWPRQWRASARSRQRRIPRCGYRQRQGEADAALVAEDADMDHQ